MITIFLDGCEVGSDSKVGVSSVVSLEVVLGSLVFLVFHRQVGYSVYEIRTERTERTFQILLQPFFRYHT